MVKVSFQKKTHIRYLLMSKFLDTFDFYSLCWVLLFFPVIIIIYSISIFPDSLLFGVSNFFIIFISYFFMGHGQRHFSLVKVVHVFNFFFFGVVPLNDLANENFYWGGARIHEESFLFVNFIILIGMFFFILGANIKSKLISFSIKKIDTKISLNFLWAYSLLFFVAFLILYFNDFNFFKLLFRGLVSDLTGSAETSYSQIQLLFIDNFLRPMPIILFSLLYVFYVRKDRGVGFVRAFFIGFFMLLAVFLVAPTAIPRFQAASLYISLLVLCTKFWNRRFSMSLTLLTSLLIIMPILDKFRHFDPDSTDWSLNLSFLNHGHFDAYQNFTRAFENNFVVYGEQLIGALFFFVPRGVWSDKPLGSGATLAEISSLDFSNISMPFMGEGYVNFGVLGVVFFMFSFGVICNNLDRYYWVTRFDDRLSSYRVFYLFLLGMFFFICRGDLTSAFAYTVGLFFSFYSCVYTLSFFSRFSNWIFYGGK